MSIEVYNLLQPAAAETEMRPSCFDSGCEPVRDACFVHEVFSLCVCVCVCVSALCCVRVLLGRGLCAVGGHQGSTRKQK
jgi:hypothetical protein